MNYFKNTKLNYFAWSVSRARRSASDQSTESAIVSLRYLDRITGQEKTIRGSADKLVIKRGELFSKYKTELFCEKLTERRTAAQTSD